MVYLFIPFCHKRSNGVILFTLPQVHSFVLMSTLVQIEQSMIFDQYFTYTVIHKNNIEIEKKSTVSRNTSPLPTKAILQR